MTEIVQKANKLEVYIIFRVFNLEKNNIGVKLYINPETAENRGELEFQVDKWVVKPRAGL
jgi:hypothetical protein